MQYLLSKYLYIGKVFGNGAI